ncbi:thiamine-monophosphate kinase [Methylacidimicrobium cyclopophantes]|uniref:Thiamine-monophosphate kinase n=1 Tax=Methylacidimicrobium cyclopophantes TaxID=1041766 RepID=A0A5E6M9B1_9BACT|nr:thiamine-phosphate kinase [Methylacidimicrobium cyclopophantes]VVM06152.1 thiamine-monophosphate kinase [Methylacidimicrobium cyclopophantes]
MRRRKPVFDRTTLAALGEDGLLRLLTSRWRPGPTVRTGVGDDCAVLAGRGTDHSLLFKVDSVVEGVHFPPDTPFRLVGRKALARGLSDIAAMGGRPLDALIALALPATAAASAVRDLYRGIERLARQSGVDLVGGELSRSRQLVLTIALLGETAGYPPLLRSGAHPGEGLYVTGSLGGSLSSGRHLRFRPRLSEGRWLAEGRWATSLMDISDGLAADLPRLARASRVDFSVDESRLPRHRGCSVKEALCDGEDYELLFTVPPDREAALRREWPFSTRLSRIGLCLRPSAAARTLPDSHGFDHFRLS